MSIASFQKRKVYLSALRGLLQRGVKPTQKEIRDIVDNYFSSYPQGAPLPVFRAGSIGDKLIANEEVVNELFLNAATNLDDVYATIQEQLNEQRQLTTTLNLELEHLTSKRRAVLAKIDDHLLSTNNTDGYFYSVSDPFVDLTMTDTSLSTAFMDTETNTVSLPYNSAKNNIVKYDDFIPGSVRAFIGDEEVYKIEKTPIKHAFDGAINTVWSLEVETETPEEVVLIIDIGLRNLNTDKLFEISRLTIAPYGIEPVQMFVEKFDSEGNVYNFSDIIRTVYDSATFVTNADPIATVRITMRKDKPDYILDKDGVAVNRYIFGAKKITMSEQFYDNNAKFITTPITLPEDLDDSNTIDAISLATKEDIPLSTTVNYYIAENDTTANEIGDFNWRKIQPITQNRSTTDHEVIRLDGTLQNSVNLRRDPQGLDIEIIPGDISNDDLLKRNPSPSIISTAPIYRLGKFESNFVPESLRLEEGTNTTKIYYTDYSEDAIDDLTYWGDRIKEDVEPYDVTYGRIDTGNGFFYGGSIGRSGVSAYIETYVHLDQDMDALVRQITKADPNSKQWDIRVYLNGNDIAYMPNGTDSAVSTWNLKEGVNHIALLVNIPEATDIYPNVYLGQISLLGLDDSFINYGNVKLATWNYVDFFQMEYNEVGEPYTFTVHDNEIISRRNPTDNFRLQFTETYPNAPNGIRLRADLSRANDNPSLTPLLREYRLRFSYGDRLL